MQLCEHKLLQLQEAHRQALHEVELKLEDATRTQQHELQSLSSKHRVELNGQKAVYEASALKEQENFRRVSKASCTIRGP